MKNERALFKIPIKELAVTLPGPIKEERKNQYSKSKYVVTVVTYGYTARVLNGNILEVTVFNHKSGAAEYRIFIGDYDYISQVYDKKSREWRRSTSKLSKWYYTVTDYKRYLTDEQSRTEAMKWLGGFEKGNPDIFRRISLYVDNIGKRKLKEKHDRIRESIDDIMLQIRPIPKDFDKWADEVAFRENRYIMYQYSRKKETDGYCTHCQQHVRVTGAKHKQRGVCPNCKSPITYLAQGKTSNFGINKNLIYFQSGADGEIIIRYFDASRNFFHTGDKLREYNICTEEEREFYHASRCFKYSEFCNTGEYRFCEIKEKHIYNSGHIYGNNLKAVFEKALPQYAHLKYIPYTRLLNNMGTVSGISFFLRVVQYPQIEIMAKFGMYSLCRDLIAGNYNVIELQDKDYFKAHKIKKADIDIIRRYNMNFRQLKIYFNCREYEKSALVHLMKLCDSGEIHFAEYASRALKYMPYDSFTEYIKTQIPHYIEKTYPRTNAAARRLVTGEWLDYIESCERLGWNLRDTKVLKPKDLAARHNAATELCKLLEQKINQRDLQKRYYDNIFRFGYSGSDFSVTVPRDIYDLKYEGDKLKHCVYTNYAGKAARGESVIVFIRSNDKFYKPLATAEINPKTYEVIQIRGYRNNNVTPDVKKFFEKYKKDVLEKLKKRERTAA